VQDPLNFQLLVKHLPTDCFALDDKEPEAYPAVSKESGLDQVLSLFKAGAEKVAVFVAPESRSGFRGTLDWQGLFKFLETSMQVAAARMSSLLQSSYDAVCMVDEHEQVIFWNRQAEDLYGIKQEEILGKDIHLFFDNLVLTEVLKSKVPVLGSYHQPRVGTYVLINAYPVLLHDRVIGSISVERDITNMVLLNRELIRANKRADFLVEEMAKIGQEADPFEEICGRSQNFRQVLEVARKVASTDAIVLLYGESGTGKEILARALHSGGPRKDKPFIPVNCSAIPHNLFESELFGYEGGAFTGAEKKGKPGKFTMAHGGTILLDEISELDPALQVKLLRVLQDQVYYPVGGSKPCRVDVRIIVATNRNLAQLVEQGLFREDLYYRMNVVHIRIPPLRERKNDIPELAYLFLAEFSKVYQKKVMDIDPAVMTYFLRYHWPGNIRELRNVVERMVVLSEGGCLTVEMLPAELRSSKATFRESLTSESPLAEVTENLERELIVNALADCGGNKASAAHRLGLPRSSLYYRINKLGITEQDYLPQPSDTGH
jgi:PAS domain S-box-containing protein